VALAALTEELLFRGALHALIERSARRLWAPRDAGRGAGIVAAAGAAVVFALLHWDLAGGVGIVRVISALCLGIACGAARYATGSVAAPVALHLVHNALAVGQARRWFAGDGPPPFESLPLPGPLFGLAALGLAAFVALTGASAIARRRAARARVD
jgi:membrane protease YdiL (CAAX protease family)